MTRLASVVVAIIVVFVSLPAAAQDPAAAQGMALTVSAPSAAVRKSPSVASPVVGQAPRGAVLDVTRDVGSWVKVTWPDAQDGIGYVSLYAALCPEGRCQVTDQDGLPLAFDYGHLTASGSTFVAQQIKRSGAL